MMGSKIRHQTARNAQGGDSSTILCLRLDQQSRALWRFLLRFKADPMTFRAPRVDRRGASRCPSATGALITFPVAGANPTPDEINVNLLNLLAWAHGGC